MKSKISYAVAAILGGTSVAAMAQEQATSTEAAASEGITEVIVTAQRRSEKMQDVPISMQALTGQTLQQLNIQTFDDFLKYLPNVTSASNGPGQNEVFMRGLSAGSQASQGSGSTGLWPNVAIYLDNQSGQLPNRNLDIYAADIDRIEVLAPRAHSSVRVPRRGSSATLPMRRSSIAPRGTSRPATASPLTVIRIPPCRRC